MSSVQNPFKGIVILSLFIYLAGSKIRCIFLILKQLRITSLQYTNLLEEYKIYDVKQLRDCCA